MLLNIRSRALTLSSKPIEMISFQNDKCNLCNRNVERGVEQQRRKLLLLDGNMSQSLDFWVGSIFCLLLWRTWIELWSCTKWKQARDLSCVFYFYFQLFINSPFRRKGVKIRCPISSVKLRPDGHAAADFKFKYSCLELGLKAFKGTQHCCCLFAMYGTLYKTTTNLTEPL